MKVNVQKLRELAEWATEEHYKKMRGERSEWDQTSWFVLYSDLAKDTENFDPLDDDSDDGEIDRIDFEDKKILAEIDELSCGTVACIAGRTALTEGYRPWIDGTGWVSGIYVKKRGESYALDNRRDVGDVAQEILGLSDRQANRLFDGGNTIRHIWYYAREFTNGAIDIPEEFLNFSVVPEPIEDDDDSYMYMMEEF